MRSPPPVFPPLLKGRAVKGSRCPFEYACTQAAQGGLGAGDLVWSPATQRAASAVVLQPEVPLGKSLQMGALTQIALADCLGILLPPRVVVQLRWPGDVLVNGACAGEVQLGAPGTPADSVPPWLVAGFSLRIRHDTPGKEPGEMPGVTSLAEEGGAHLTRNEILETFAAYFVRWVDTWMHEGFRPVHDSWMMRVTEAGGGAFSQEANGAARVIGLDEEGGLILRAVNGDVHVLSLAGHLVRCGAEADHS